MNNFFKLTIYRFVIFQFWLVLMGFFSTCALAAFVEPNDCGGVGQAPCELSSARFLGPVYNPKPHNDAFVDLRLDKPSLGAEWWRCPTSHPNRTISGISTTSACETSVPLVTTNGLALPFRDPRNGGEVWICPSSHPWRTVYPVHQGWACGKSSVTTNYASAIYIGTAYGSAIYLAKYENPKPTSSAFIDPRLDLDFNPLNTGNDEYWECPTGFWRNANPVTHGAACTVNIGQNCDDGNIAAGTPWDGYICQARGVCGGLGERPCQIVERAISCDPGLAEDFIDHACVDKEMAACLTATRLMSATNEVIETVDKYTKKSVLEYAAEKLYDVLPSDVQDGLDTAAEAVNGVTDDIEAEIDQAMDSAIAEFSGRTDLAELFDRVADNQSELLKFVGSPSTCLMSDSEKISKLNSILDYDIGAQTLAGLDFGPSMLQQLAQFLVPAAHAGDIIPGVVSIVDGYPFIIIGGSASAAYFGGLNGDLFIAIGENQVKTFFTLSAVATSAKGGGGSFNFGINIAENIADIEGWGSSVGFSFVAQSKIKSASYGSAISGDLTASLPDTGPSAGVPMSNVVLNSLNNIDGLMFSFGAAQLSSMIEVNSSLGYTWMLGKDNDPMVKAGNISSEAITYTTNTTEIDPKIWAASVLW